MHMHTCNVTYEAGKRFFYANTERVMLAHTSARTDLSKSVKHDHGKLWHTVFSCKVYN